MAADPTPAWKVLNFQKINQLNNLFYLQEFRKTLSGELISMGGVKYVIEHILMGNKNYFRQIEKCLSKVKKLFLDRLRDESKTGLL